MVNSTEHHTNQVFMLENVSAYCTLIILPVWEGNNARTRQNRATSAGLLPPMMSCEEEQMKQFCEISITTWMDYHRSLLVLTPYWPSVSKPQLWHCSYRNVIITNLCQYHTPTIWLLIFVHPPALQRCFSSSFDACPFYPLGGNRCNSQNAEDALLLLFCSFCTKIPVSVSS